MLCVPNPAHADLRALVVHRMRLVRIWTMLRNGDQEVRALLEMALAKLGAAALR